MVLLMVLYSFALAMSLLLAAPWWLFRMLTTERYREGLPERLGRVPAVVRAALAGKRVVWLHAVSVGEVLAASSLAAELTSQLGPGWEVAVSTTTRTGQQLARKRFPQAVVFYFPLDFKFAVRAWLEALHPELVVLTESEVWPRFLHECARAGIPAAVVNARISDRSFKRAMRYNSAWRWLTRDVTFWLAQSDGDASRLIQLGAPAERVQVSGNLKYDIRAPKASLMVDRIFRAAAGRRILVAGSTLGSNPPEDSLLLRVQQAIPPQRRPLLVLAPRKPEDFGPIYAMASEFPAVLASELPAGDVPGASGEQPQVVVLDTIGDLAAVYAIADIAFVGGSLLRRGGHNPLEPAQFGVPIVMGPSFENFREIVTRLREADAICIVGEEAAPHLHPDSVRDPDHVLLDGLSAAVTHLLEDRTAARAMGERARAVFEQEGGATARTVAALLPLLNLDGTENANTLGASSMTRPHRGMIGDAPLAHARDADLDKGVSQ